MKKIFLIAACCISLDQLIKIFITNIFSFGESLEIVTNFFAITLLKNTGAAFSILSSNTPFLIFISIIALILIYFSFIKNKNLNKPDIILYGMLIGGIIGNLLDRIIHGYVIDYLDFNIFNFPVFNLADILIVTSIFFIIIKMIKGEKHGIQSR